MLITKYLNTSKEMKLIIFNKLINHLFFSKVAYVIIRF